MRTVLDRCLPRPYPSHCLLKGNLQGQGGKEVKSKAQVLLRVEAGTPEEEARRWADFWDALDFIRLQLQAPLQSSFVAVKLLPIRERLALPGATARTRITGGDATLDRIGAVDWGAKVFHASTVGKYREALRGIASSEDETDIDIICRPRWGGAQKLD